MPQAITRKAGYPPYLARSVWSEIEGADDEIRRAFAAWLSDEPVPEVAVGELTLRSLAGDARAIPESLAVLAHCRRDPHFAAKVGSYDRIVDEG